MGEVQREIVRSRGRQGPTTGREGSPRFELRKRSGHERDLVLRERGGLAREREGGREREREEVESGSERW